MTTESRAGERRSWIDRLYLGSTGVGTLFRDGWGDRAFIAKMAAFDRLGAEAVSEPRAIEFRPFAVKSGVHMAIAELPSPVRDGSLPRGSERVTVWLASPYDDVRVRGRSFCVHLAGSGDAGVHGRLRGLAAPLARQGVVNAILENPFYGRRRPDGQRGTALRTVSDLMAMFRACAWEALELVRWAKREGARAIAVTGISMGAQAAAVVGAVSDVPVATIACLAPVCVASEYSDGLLSRRCNWRALASQLEIDEHEARRRLHTALAVADLRRFPAPQRSDAAIVVTANGDAIVPPELGRQLHEHWPGSEHRRIAGGHVTAYLTRKATFRRAILDGLHRISRAGAAVRT